jgi:hypothetical protein
MHARLWLIAFLLFIPCAAILSVGFYNRIEPSWNGIPFFYWYQLAWAPLSSIFLGLAYFVARRGESR